MISTFKTFSVDKAFYTSFKKYFQAIGTSIVVVVSAMLLSFIMCGGLGLSFYGIYQLLLAHKTGVMPWTIASALRVLFFAASAIGLCLGYGALLAGMVKASLDLYRTGTAKISTLFSCFDNAVQVTFAILLVGIASFFGLLLLVIPGLIVLCRVLFALYFIVDYNMSAIEAIKASWHATRGNVLKIMGVLFILGIVSSSLYLLAMPLSWFVFAYIYEALSGRDSETIKELSASE